MVIKCLECKLKCGLPFNLAFHYSICHEDKIIKCECGDKTLSGICIKKFAERSCFAISPIKTDCSFNVNDNVNVIINDNVNVNDDVNVSDNNKFNVNVTDNIIDLRSSFANNINQNNANPNPNVNVSENPRNNKVLIRNCNKCNSVKSLTDFDENKYTCRNCTSAKVNCLYCPSVVRYDGISALVKKQHPDVELTRGFSRSLNPRRAITQTGESCSCKYYNFVSFLINNGINIEKAKENINLLKSIDNLK